MAKQGAKAVTPKLRFPEFRGSDAWTVDTLASAARLVKDKIAVEKLCLDNYVSTENLAPDYGGVTVATKLPDVGSVTHFKRDDVLISNIRPYLRKVWQADRDGGASNDVIVLRRKSIISDAFLALVLRNDAFIAYVMESAKGVKMPRGDIDAMRAYKVAHPEPAEQNKIADCLTSLDEVIAAQGRKVDALKAHKRGLMQQLFPREGETRPRLRFPEFRSAPEWEAEPLAYYIARLDAGVSVNSGDKPARSGQVGVLKTSCVASGVFDPNQNKVVQDLSEVERVKEPVRANTILISRMNTVSLVGANAFVDKDVPNLFLPDRLWAAKATPKGHARFLAYVLGSERGRAALSGLASGSSGTMKNIGKAEVLALQISAPSLPEQERIADCLASLDTRISAETARLAALKTHKQGLMQQLFPVPEAT